jgi:hypothetical protein
MTKEMKPLDYVHCNAAVFDCPMLKGTGHEWQLDTLGRKAWKIVYILYYVAHVA